MPEIEDYDPSADAPSSPADVPYYEVAEAVEAAKAEFAAAKADLEAEVAHLKEDAERLAATIKEHATEIIRLHGVIADTVAPWVRKQSEKFIQGIREWAKALAD
jgi:ribosomal protein L9